MRERLKAIFINATIIVILCFLLFLGGTWWRMNAQFALGETASRKGDFAGAVAGYESALHMYIPFVKTIDAAAVRLWDLGEANERQGDINRALIAYRALRSAFYADRWLVTPGMDWIARCDRKIAALVPLQRDR